MKIQDMFVDDINRKINGVIKVDQEDTTTEQELNEYVITRELKRHFITFFNYYDDAFDTPTADIGVWISGFFGSGKSHFLKMLSYILENRTINGIPTIERFRKKFADDPGTFMLIDKATKVPTETILFNIDIEGFSNKDNTAVLKVFAKMFYNHLGFLGEDLKVAKLEQFVAKQGKTDDFRRVFEEKNGAPWVETRESFGFFEDDVVETLEEVLGMSETAARNWFNGTETAEISIAQLVSEIKEYVDSKPKNFRLLFMVDEVGQYVGTDTNLLLNLQSLVEKVGSECSGKVWIVCTGQEAIDEIIRVRIDEFSRIQARFKTRLSLSSSAVDEVIQKRLLTKKSEAKTVLTDLYERNDYVLKNLFSFTDSVLDIKGYSGSGEFVENYPFVPYQFILTQKIFSEIRKHGAAGKHYSGAERSMLDGFQIVARSIEEKDEHAIAPLYPFYDSVHSFLDGSIRRVIERCQKAADDQNGIEDYDVKVLKLLYLIRYIDDVKANLDNIVILMADDIRTDKIELRQIVQKSLDRLKSQNYIDCRGDAYIFLTDEEQDIARDIANTTVDTAKIVERIGQMIFGDIYTQKKYRYGKYDFPFDEMVDSTAVGTMTGAMKLRFLTVASDAMDKQELRLMTESKGAAIVVLADTPYYESLENAMKIRKYVKQRNVNQMAKSVQDIIRDQQDEAGQNETSAKEDLEKAITGAQFYVDGEHISVNGSTASTRIDDALNYLVAHIYSELNLITKNAESDADVINILHGTTPQIEGTEYNRDAAAKIEEYLEMQSAKKLPTSMDDIQTRYQNIPYGWKEIDIAAVVALLIYQQKVTIKYGGVTIRPDDPKLPDMLRKRSERGKAMISMKQSASAQKMKAAKEIMREYFDIMDVPDDEDGLVMKIIEEFKEQKYHYEALRKRYEGHKYPDHNKVIAAIQLMDDILSQQKDNIALIDRLVADETDLFDSKDDLSPVEGFFKNQVTLFDAAAKMVADLRNDLPYIQKNEETNTALNQIRKITMVDGNNPRVYKEIPQLNRLMDTVRAGHNKLLEEKRKDLLEIVRQCLAEIHQAGGVRGEHKNAIEKADNYFEQMKEQIATTKTIVLLDGMTTQMWNYKDDTVASIETAKQPPTPVTPPQPNQPKKQIKNVYRQAIFKQATLESQADVDAYVERMRSYLTALLKDSDGIKLN
ncbi:BREX system P-loop protein BrxC [Hornefia butyriciproducens]|uniref:BREX system P-loop protein BrxC n=1 Tax=Hornefia butyriciproducens TaxID=2652293 RepID=UPI003F8CA62B